MSKPKYISYGYNMAGGDHTFDAIMLDAVSSNITVQIEFSGVNANDATLEIFQSLDKTNWDTITDSAGNKAVATLDATGGAVTATLNITGFKLSMIKPVLTVNSVTVGTIVKLVILN